MDSSPKDRKAMALMPNKFGGAPTKWALFKTKFEAYMNSLSEEYHSVLSHSRYRYDYDEPTDPRADAMVNDIMPLYRHPNNINEHSKTIYSTLKSLTSDGDAYTHVLAPEATQDGCNAWISLCAFYEGPALMSIATEEVRLNMEAARYTGGDKGFTFQKYLTTHLQAYVLLEQNPTLSTTYSEFHKKDRILKEIKCLNLRMVVKVARSEQEWIFLQTINYLRSSVPTRS